MVLFTDKLSKSVFSFVILFQIQSYMKKRLLFSFAIFCAVVNLVAANDSTNTTPKKLVADPVNAGLKTPSGFSASIVADNLGRARHIVATEQGGIYVKLERLKEGKGIVYLKDADGDGKMEINKTFANYYGTGIAIKNGYLYASSD